MSPTTRPSVTVIIRGYDDLEFVVEQLQAQTLQPYEIILDSKVCYSASGEKIKKYLARQFPDTQIEVAIHYAAQGAFVFAMTPRTALKEQCLEVLTDLLMTHKDATFASCCPMVYEDNPRRWIRMHDAWDAEPDFYRGELVRRQLNGRRFSNGHVLFKRRHWFDDPFRVLRLAAERGFCYTPMGLHARPKHELEIHYNLEDILKQAQRTHSFDHGLGPVLNAGLLIHSHDDILTQIKSLPEQDSAHLQILQSGMHAQIAGDRQRIARNASRFSQLCRIPGMVQEVVAWSQRKQVCQLGFWGSQSVWQRLVAQWPVGAKQPIFVDSQSLHEVDGLLSCQPTAVPSTFQGPVFKMPQEVLQ